MTLLSFKRPEPDTDRYNATLERGFARFPKRRENYLHFRKAGRGERCDYLPVKLDIENVSRCNLRCTMCQIPLFPGGRRAEDLTLADFKQILNAQIGVVELKLQGTGEPFLDRDFCEMVAYASARDIWVRSTTNATVLHLNDNYRRIVDAGIGELQVSLDGTSAQVYQKIRVNADFARVTENCRLLNGYCELQGVDRTRMWVLLQEENFGELHAFPALARELGFKRLTISMDLHYWGNDLLQAKNLDKRVSARLTQADIDRMQGEADRLGIELSFWDISTKYTRENLCPWPFERAFISSDKRVVPCCMIANPDISSMGELGDFGELWNAESYAAFRKAHLTGKLPEICNYCYQSEEL